MSVGRVNLARAAYRSAPGTRTRLSIAKVSGVSASEYLLRSVALRTSSSAPVRPAPRKFLASVLKRIAAGWRLGRGNVVQARLARIAGSNAGCGQPRRPATEEPIVEFQSRRLQ